MAINNKNEYNASVTNQFPTQAQGNTTNQITANRFQSFFNDMMNWIFSKRDPLDDTNRPAVTQAVDSGKYLRLDYDNANRPTFTWSNVNNIVDWANGKAYVVGDYVLYNGDLYKVVAAHTSTNSFPPITGEQVYTLWYQHVTSYLSQPDSQNTGSPATGRKLGIDNATGAIDIVDDPATNSELTHYQIIRNSITGFLQKIPQVYGSKVVYLDPTNGFSSSNGRKGDPKRPFLNWEDAWNASTDGDTIVCFGGIINTSFYVTPNTGKDVSLYFVNTTINFTPPLVNGLANVNDVPTFYSNNIANGGTTSVTVIGRGCVLNINNPISGYTVGSHITGGFVICPFSQKVYFEWDTITGYGCHLNITRASNSYIKLFRSIKNGITENGNTSVGSTTGRSSQIVVSTSNSYLYIGSLERTLTGITDKNSGLLISANVSGNHVLEVDNIFDNAAYQISGINYLCSNVDWMVSSTTDRTIVNIKIKKSVFINTTQQSREVMTMGSNFKGGLINLSINDLYINKNINIDPGYGCIIGGNFNGSGFSGTINIDRCFIRTTNPMTANLQGAFGIYSQTSSQESDEAVSLKVKEGVIDGINFVTYQNKNKDLSQISNIDANVIVYNANAIYVNTENNPFDLSATLIVKGTYVVKTAGFKVLNTSNAGGNAKTLRVIFKDAICHAVTVAGMFTINNNAPNQIKYMFQNTICNGVGTSISTSGAPTYMCSATSPLIEDNTLDI